MSDHAPRVLGMTAQVVSPPQAVAEIPLDRPARKQRGDGARAVDGVEVVGSLSPSRAGDFMTCPLLYRYRTIDKLPEESSPAAVRGTLVHKVLEDLFDLPAVERTPERALSMVEPAWADLLDSEPDLA